MKNIHKGFLVLIVVAALLLVVYAFNCHALDWYGDSISCDLAKIEVAKNTGADVDSRGWPSEGTGKTLARVEKSIDAGERDSIIITTGTAAIRGGAGVDVLLKAIKGSIAYCFKKDDNLDISLSLIPYTTHDDLNKKITVFNDGIRAIVGDKSFAGYDLKIIDFNTTIHKTDLKPDGVHLKGGINWLK